MYRGTARFYDEFRVPYPAALLDDLSRRAGANGRGRMLDLACGTGQLAFGLASRFAGVCAVDQESEAIEFARSEGSGPRSGEYSVAGDAGGGPRSRPRVRSRHDRQRVSPPAASARGRVGSALADPGRVLGPRVEQVSVGRRPRMAARPRADRARLGRGGRGRRPGPGGTGPAPRRRTARVRPHRRRVHDRGRLRLPDRATSGPSSGCSDSSPRPRFCRRSRSDRTRRRSNETHARASWRSGPATSFARRSTSTTRSRVSVEVFAGADQVSITSS